MEKETRNKTCSFSIELRSKANLKNLTLTNDLSQNVLIDGVLGDLERVNFAEAIIVEIVGSNGVLRVDVSPQEFKMALPKEIKGVK